MAPHRRHWPAIVAISVKATPRALHRVNAPRRPRFAASGLALPKFRPKAYRAAKLSLKPLARRRDFGNQIANELLVRQRRERHGARLEAGGAGIDRVAVELDHALLAGIGVDAGEAHRQRRVLVDAQPAQAVEHRLAGLEGHVVGLPLRRVAVVAALDFQRRDLLGLTLGFLVHDASASAVAGAPEICSSPSRS